MHTTLWIISMLAFACARSVFADSCYPINTANLNFGSYQPEEQHDLDVDTTIDIYCAPAFRGRELHVRVNLIGMTDKSERRVMNNIITKDEAYFILFRDAARTIPLIEQMEIPVTDIIPQSKIFTIRLYGRLLARQNIGTGIYIAQTIINIDY